MLREAAFKFSHNADFAEKYTDSFVEREIRDQIVPDLLIEILDEKDSQVDFILERPTRH